MSSQTNTQDSANHQAAGQQLIKTSAGPINPPTTTASIENNIPAIAATQIAGQSVQFHSGAHNPANTVFWEDLNARTAVNPVSDQALGFPRDLNINLSTIHNQTTANAGIASVNQSYAPSATGSAAAVQNAHHRLVLAANDPHFAQSNLPPVTTGLQLGGNDLFAGTNGLQFDDSLFFDPNGAQLVDEHLFDNFTNSSLDFIDRFNNVENTPLDSNAIPAANVATAITGSNTTHAISNHPVVAAGTSAYPIKFVETSKVTPGPMTNTENTASDPALVQSKPLSSAPDATATSSTPQPTTSPAGKFNESQTTVESFATVTHAAQDVGSPDYGPPSDDEQSQADGAHVGNEWTYDEFSMFPPPSPSSEGDSYHTVYPPDVPNPTPSIEVPEEPMFPGVNVPHGPYGGSYLLTGTSIIDHPAGHSYPGINNDYLDGAPHSHVSDDVEYEEIDSPVSLSDYFDLTGADIRTTHVATAHNNTAAINKNVAHPAAEADVQVIADATNPKINNYVNAAPSPVRKSNSAYQQANGSRPKQQAIASSNLDEAHRQSNDDREDSPERAASVSATDVDLELYDFLSDHPETIQKILIDHPIMLLNILNAHPGLTEYKRVSGTMFCVDVAINVPRGAQHLLNRNPRLAKSVPGRLNIPCSSNSQRQDQLKRLNQVPPTHFEEIAEPSTRKRARPVNEDEHDELGSTEQPPHKVTRRIGTDQVSTAQPRHVRHDPIESAPVAQNPITGMPISTSASIQPALPRASKPSFTATQLAISRADYPATAAPSPQGSVSHPIKFLTPGVPSPPLGHLTPGHNFVSAKMAAMAAQGIKLTDLIMTKGGKKPAANQTPATDSRHAPVMSNTQPKRTQTAVPMPQVNPGTQKEQPKQPPKVFYGVNSHGPPLPKLTPAQRAKQESAKIMASKGPASTMPPPSHPRSMMPPPPPPMIRQSTTGYNMMAPARVSDRYAASIASGCVAPNDTLLDQSHLTPMAPTRPQTVAPPVKPTPKPQPTPSVSAQVMTAGADDDTSIPYPAPQDLINQSRHLPQTAAWRLFEQDIAIKHMLDIRDEGMIKGEKRFEEVSKRLLQYNSISRSLNGVKNFWNRISRARSGFDERKNKSAPLATSKQGKKAREQKAKNTVQDASIATGSSSNKRKRDESEDVDDMTTSKPVQSPHHHQSLSDGNIGTAQTNNAIDQEVLRAAQTGLRPRKRMNFDVEADDDVLREPF